MKNLFIVLMFISLGITLSCSAQKHSSKEIGVLLHDAPEITMDHKVLTDKWESVLRSGGVEIDITEVEIVQNRDGSYLLMGTNSEHSIFSCLEVLLVDSKFYEALSDEGSGLTVSCSGCALGCHPEIINGKGYCTPLCTGCSKTETLTSGGVL